MPRTKKSVQTKRKQRKARGGDGEQPVDTETRPAEIVPSTAPAATPAVEEKPWWRFWAGKGRKSRKNHKKSVKGKSKK